MLGPLTWHSDRSQLSIQHRKIALEVPQFFLCPIFASNVVTSSSKVCIQSSQDTNVKSDRRVSACTLFSFCSLRVLCLVSPDLASFLFG